MAKTPDAAMALMMQVWPAAVARVHEEVADMQAIADKRRREASRSRPGTTATTPRRCARRSTTSIMNEVKPYLQLDKLREGMFWAAGQLYGFELHPGARTCRSTIPT